MSIVSHRIPGAVGRLFSYFPVYPGSLLFASGLNIALRPQLPADTLRLLEGHALRIRVNDARIAFDFIWRNGAFNAARHRGEISLAISASAYDFLLLMQGKEDPDTLFFSRRLSMEGDTELGLLVKNSLDAIDFSGHHPVRYFTSRSRRGGARKAN